MGVVPGETIKEYAEKEAPAATAEVNDPTDASAEAPATPPEAPAGAVLDTDVVEPHSNS